MNYTILPTSFAIDEFLRPWPEDFQELSTSWKAMAGLMHSVASFIAAVGGGENGSLETVLEAVSTVPAAATAISPAGVRPAGTAAAAWAVPAAAAVTLAPTMSGRGGGRRTELLFTEYNTLYFSQKYCIGLDVYVLVCSTCVKCE